MIIYVSSPYSSPDLHVKAQNVERAVRAGMALIKNGHAPIVPHSMAQNWDTSGIVMDDEVRRVLKEILLRCDAVVKLGESRGTRQDEAWAREKGIPVYTSVEEVPNASK